MESAVKSTMSKSVKHRPPKQGAKKRAEKADVVSRPKYVLRLYITGTTPRSQHALANIKRICEDYLKNEYELKVIDIYQSPKLAKDEQIIATPTLIKMLPTPLRRLIGDFSNEDRVLLGLDIQVRKA